MMIGKTNAISGGNAIELNPVIISASLLTTTTSKRAFSRIFLNKDNTKFYQLIISTPIDAVIDPINVITKGFNIISINTTTTNFSLANISKSNIIKILNDAGCNKLPNGKYNIAFSGNNQSPSSFPETTDSIIALSPSGSQFIVENGVINLTNSLDMPIYYNSYPDSDHYIFPVFLERVS